MFQGERTPLIIPRDIDIDAVKGFLPYLHRYKLREIEAVYPITKRFVGILETTPQYEALKPTEHLWPVENFFGVDPPAVITNTASTSTANEEPVTAAPVRLGSPIQLRTETPSSLPGLLPLADSSDEEEPDPPSEEQGREPPMQVPTYIEPYRRVPGGRDIFRYTGHIVACLYAAFALQLTTGERLRYPDAFSIVEFFSPRPFTFLTQMLDLYRGATFELFTQNILSTSGNTNLVASVYIATYIKGPGYTIRRHPHPIMRGPPPEDHTTVDTLYGAVTMNNLPAAVEQAVLANPSSPPGLPPRGVTIEPGTPSVVAEDLPEATEANAQRDDAAIRREVNRIFSFQGFPISAIRSSQVQRQNTPAPPYEPRRRSEARPAQTPRTPRPRARPDQRQTRGRPEQRTRTPGTPRGNSNLFSSSL